MNPLPTVNHAFAIISQEESHRSLMSVIPQQLESTAFFSTQNRKRNDVRCEHCNWTGHNKENCFRLIGYPPGHKLYKGQWKGGTQRFSREGNDRGKSMGKANVSVAGSGEMEHSNQSKNIGSVFTHDQYAAILKLLAKEQLDSETNTSIPSANMAGIDNSNSNLAIEWIIDTGANDHMVGHRGLLGNFKSYADDTGSIQLPNGNTTKISSLGTISINKTITLSNVLLVPDFHHNLFSISKFTKDHNCFVIFFPTVLCVLGPLKWEDNGDW